MLIIFHTSDKFYEVLCRVEAQHNILRVVIAEINPQYNMSSIPISKAMASQLSMHMTRQERSETSQENLVANNQTTPSYHMSRPHKYNGKLMNSIWGMYNMYSPPSFQKNLELQGMASPVGSKAAGFLW